MRRILSSIAVICSTTALAGCAANTVMLGPLVKELWSNETTPIACTITLPNKAPALGSTCLFEVEGEGTATPASAVIPMASATGTVTSTFTAKVVTKDETAIVTAEEDVLFRNPSSAPQTIIVHPLRASAVSTAGEAVRVSPKVSGQTYTYIIEASGASGPLDVIQAASFAFLVPVTVLTTSSACNTVSINGGVISAPPGATPTKVVSCNVTSSTAIIVVRAGDASDGGSAALTLSLGPSGTKPTPLTVGVTGPKP